LYVKKNTYFTIYKKIASKFVTVKKKQPCDMNGL